MITSIQKNNFGNLKIWLLLFLVSFIPRLYATLSLPVNTGVGAMGVLTVDAALGLIEKKEFVIECSLSDIQQAMEEHWTLAETLERSKISDPDGPTDRMPVYPLLLAIYILISGSLNLFGFQLIQIALDSCSPFLLYLVCIYFIPRPWAMVSGLIYGIWPAFILYSFVIHDGAFSQFIHLVILYLLVSDHFNKRKNHLTLIFVAVLAALSLLLRSDAIWLSLFVGTAILLKKNQRIVRRLGNILLYGFVFFTAISPWLIRNYNYYGRLMIGSPFYPFVLWEGLGGFPRLFPTYANLNDDAEIPKLAIANGYKGSLEFRHTKQAQIDFNNFLGNLFTEKILKEQPIRYGVHIFLKFVRYTLSHKHIAFPTEFMSLPIPHLIARMFDNVLLPAMMIFLLISLHGCRSFMFLYLFPVCSGLAHVFSVVNEPRYFVAGTVVYPLYITITTMYTLALMNRRTTRQLS